MKVWVLSAEATELALIVASLAEEGFEARGFQIADDLDVALSSGRPPDVLVLDTNVPKLTSAEWDKLRSHAPSAVTFLMTGSLVNILRADHIIRRPISIGELSTVIKTIIGGLK